MSTVPPVTRPGGRGRRRSAAFTLVEIMIVVAILGIVLGMGIPSMFRAMNREGIRAATADVLEACAKARSAAILSGSMVELVIVPETRQFSLQVGAAPVEPESVLDARPELDGLAAEEAPAPRPAIAPFSVTLSDAIAIELLDLNFVEQKDAPQARVRFHPNSTSDEFTIVLRSKNDEWRKISLEVTTGLATMELIK